MNLPGRLEMQRALIADYANVVARFDAEPALAFMLEFIEGTRMHEARP